MPSDWPDRNAGEFISRNTYGLFDCDDQDPTAFFSLEDAVKDGHLVPYEVFTHTTKFLREGIKYRNLTLSRSSSWKKTAKPGVIGSEATSVDKQIYNKDTMGIIRADENGIKEAVTTPGKSIIFFNPITLFDAAAV